MTNNVEDEVESLAHQRMAMTPATGEIWINEKKFKKIDLTWYSWGSCARSPPVE